MGEEKKKSSILKKLLKVLCWIVGIILALAIVIVVFINPLVETTINEVAPKILGVPVSVDSVNIFPLRGRAEIYNLVVGNPKGYSSPNAAVIGEASVDVKLTSLFGRKIVIEDVTARNVNINIDMPAHDGRVNLLEIANNLNEDKKSSPEKAEKKPAKEEKTSDDDGKKEAKGIEIDNFELDNVGVTFITAGKGSEVRLSVKIDPIKDLGKDDPEGLTPFELTLSIVNSVITQSTSAAVMGGVKGLKLDKLNDATAEACKDAAAQSGKMIDDATKSLKKNFKGQDEEIDKAAEKAKDFLKGLF